MNINIINLDSYNDIFNHIKHNVLSGIHLGPLKMSGGYKLGSTEELIEDLNNIKYVINNLDDSIISFDNIIESLKILCHNNIKLLESFNNYMKNIKEQSLTINNEILGDFILENQTLLKEYDKYFHIYIIYNIIDFIKNNSKIDETFLQPISLLYNKNIYIGSSGYDTQETNYWDIIYSRTSNNIELYSKHFNSIEINHTYYNNYDKEHWISIYDKINNVIDTSDKLRLSIIFNKNISNLLLDEYNINNILDNYNSINIDDMNKYEDENINLNLAINILGIFKEFFDDKMSHFILILIYYIDNIF